MIDPSGENDHRCHWLVSEADQRWAIAASRFAPELLPSPWMPVVVSGDRAKIIAELAKRHQQPPVVIWESVHGSLLDVCESLIHANRVRPGILQLVAATARTDRERTILLELPCAALIRHPEDLIALKPMIRSYVQ